MTGFLTFVASLWAVGAMLAFVTGGQQDRAMEGLQLAALTAIYARLLK
jgi:hypothetical protein